MVKVQKVGDRLKTWINRSLFFNQDGIVSVMQTAEQLENTPDITAEVAEAKFKETIEYLLKEGTCLKFS